MATWIFDATESSRAVVPAAPTFARYQEFFDVAVPALVTADLDPPLPTMVVAHVSALPARGRSAPSGPRDRAKALLDALHDQRRSGPYFVHSRKRAPLVDDRPDFVRGLAVEVIPSGRDQTEYVLGADLVVHGEVLVAVDVGCAAPNDIWVSPAQRERIEAERADFVQALVRSWPAEPNEDVRSAATLVVRHHPARDEDNTWSTWLAAVTGRAAWSSEAWLGEPPLVNWRPNAIASVCDATLEVPTRIELIASPG